MAGLRKHKITAKEIGFCACYTPCVVKFSCRFQSIFTTAAFPAVGQVNSQHAVVCGCSLVESPLCVKNLFSTRVGGVLIYLYGLKTQSSVMVVVAVVERIDSDTAYIFFLGGLRISRQDSPIKNSCLIKNDFIDTQSVHMYSCLVLLYK